MRCFRLPLWVKVLCFFLLSLWLLVWGQGIPENVSDLPEREAGQWRASPDRPLPTMAYYYIWFEPRSWNRAKSDYPLLGRYSSDDRSVMEQHVRWAKEAGIDGFIVSWKSTLELDRRLEQLMDVAAEEDFFLWIIYQGLDFERDPLPLDLIGNDLAFFLERYAEHPAFGMYDLPVVIWSGTWEFSTADIERIAEGYRERLYLLASERNVEGVERLTGIVDGNAYYWSSVNPDTYPDYQGKLDAMSRAVHAYGGIWVAPAAPGFDATLLGGQSVIERQGGEMLRRQMQVALKSSPDALGLISWNEFSENSHIEPSQRYGTQALDSLTDNAISAVPQILDFDSSAPGTTERNNLYSLFVIIGSFLFVGAGFISLILRSSVAPKEHSRVGAGKGDGYA